ncbi:MAG TPA: hypothetical protein VFL84_02960 [Gammaproteobacteria bacterium]|nr:hypothetical protein [Gammaproteobacteria bacterium]
MKAPTRRIALAAVAAATLAVSAVAAAQSGARPDLTGSWERYRGPAGDATNPPPESQPPLKPDLLAEWQKRRQAEREADARGEPLATNYTHCIPDGVPSMMSGPFPFEIVQSASQINIAQEAYSQVRRIYLGKPQVTLDDIELGFYGRSVGEWRGDELLVDTIGIKDYVRFRDVPHTPQMRIKERFKLVRPDILWDEITIEDPAVLEKPWTVTFAYRRMPDYEIIEYVCEDNREYADEEGATRLRLLERQESR